METLRIGPGPKGVHTSLPAKAPSKLGLLVDRITSIAWGFLGVAAIFAPYLALKPATNFWWWP